MHRTILSGLILAVSCSSVLAGYQRAQDTQPDIQVPAACLPTAVSELWDAEHHLLIVDDQSGRRIVVTDLAGHLLFDGRADTPQQYALVPAPILAKVQELEQLPGVQLFKAHAAGNGVDLAIEPDWVESQHVDRGEMAISATTYLMEDGYFVMGDRPVRQVRQVTVHKLIRQSASCAQRIELTIPVVQMVFVAVETW